MQTLEKTRQNQSSLARYCRTGNYEPISGVNTENVKHYRRLVYNVIEGSLRSSYPLTYKLLTGGEWENSVNDFFSNHDCKSPQVWYMPKEFYEYVRDYNPGLAKKYPFIIELLWFEWIEVEIYMMEDIPSKYRVYGDIIKDKLVLNPESRLERFEYPVHLKKASTIVQDDKRTYFLSMHREPDSGKVQFMDLSPAFSRMIEILREGPATLTRLIEIISSELNIKLDDNIIKNIVDFFLKAIDKRLILGFSGNN